MNGQIIWLFLMLVKRSIACVEWKLIEKPVIFGETAKLLCVLENSSGNFSSRSWTGGKDFSTLTHDGISSNPKKYGELVRVNGNKNKIESTLEIFRFDENDVDCNYSCSIGLDENKQKLELTIDDFELHPRPDTATVLATFRAGYLDVIIRIAKVFPAPACSVMFNEVEITKRIVSHNGKNGIFFNMTEKLTHSFGSEICSGKLVVLCRVGKKQITIYEESFSECKEKEESKRDRSENINLIIGALAGISGMLILAVALIAVGKYSKLRQLICCEVNLRGESQLPETAATILRPLLNASVETETKPNIRDAYV